MTSPNAHSQSRTSTVPAPSVALAAVAVTAYYALSIIMLQMGTKTLGASTLADEIIAIALAPIAASGFTSLTSRAKLLIAAYFFFYLASGLFSPALSEINYPFEAFYLSLLLEAKPYIYAFAFFRLFKNNFDGSVQQITFVVLSVALANSIVCIFDWGLGSGTGVFGFPLMRGATLFHVPNGLFSHKTSSALITAAGIVAALSLARSGRRNYLALAVYLTVMLAMHNAAKEFAATAIVILTYALAPPEGSRGGLPRFAKSLLVISGIAAITIAYAIPTFSHRLDLYGSEQSVRSMMYFTSVEIATEQFPLGSGGGTFGSAPSRDVYYSDIYHLHGLSRYYGASPEFSFYLMDTWWPKILGESGIFGLIAYAWFWGALWVTLWWQYMRKRGQQLFFLLGAANLIMVSSVAASVFTSGDHMPLLGAAFGGALFLSQPRRVATRTGHSPEPLEARPYRSA